MRAPRESSPTASSTSSASTSGRRSQSVAAGVSSGRPERARLWPHTPPLRLQDQSTRDAYEINEAEMEIVRRIFHMVGVKGRSLNSVAKTLEQQSVPTPKGAKHWDRSFFKKCVLDDVYNPHTFEEVKSVVSPEVAARLD